MTILQNFYAFSKKLVSIWMRIRRVNRVIRSRPSGGDFIKKEPPAATYLILVVLFSLMAVLISFIAIHDKQFTVIFILLFVLDIYLVLTRYFSVKLGVLPYHLQIFPVGQSHIEFNSFLQIVFDMKILLYITVWGASVFFLLRANIYMGIVISLLVVIGFLLFTSVVSSIIMSVLELAGENLKEAVSVPIFVIAMLLITNLREFFVDVFLFNIFGNTLSSIFAGDMNVALINSLFILVVVSCALVVFYLFVKFKSRVNPRF
jgi:hypothetical protein